VRHSLSRSRLFSSSQRARSASPSILSSSLSSSRICFRRFAAPLSRPSSKSASDRSEQTSKKSVDCNLAFQSSEATTRLDIVPSAFVNSADALIGARSVPIGGV